MQSNECTSNLTVAKVKRMSSETADSWWQKLKRMAKPKLKPGVYNQIIEKSPQAKQFFSGLF